MGRESIGQPTLLEKAQKLLDEAKFSEAEKIAKDAVDSYTKARNEDKLAEALAALITVMAMQEKRKEAKALAKEELSRYRQAGNTSGEAFMLYALAKVYSDRMGSHGREVAAKSAQDAIALFRDQNNVKMQVECLIERAYIHVKVMDNMLEDHEKRGAEAEACIECCEEAMAFIGDDKANQAKVQNMIMVAKVHGGMEDWTQAATTAQENFKENCSQRELAANTYLVASMYFKKGKYSDASAKAQNTIAMWKELDDDLGYIASSYVLLIESHIEANEQQEAFDHAKDALLFFQRKEDKPGQAMIRSALVRLKYSEKDLNEMTAEAEAALDIIRSMDDDSVPGLRPKRWEGQLLHETAKIYCNNNNHTKALDCISKALRIYQKLKDGQAEGYALQTMCYIYLSMKDRDGHSKHGKEALKAAIAMRNCFKMQGDYKNMGLACMNIQQAQFARGKAREALKSATEAIHYFQKSKEPHREAYAYILAAHSHKALGKISEAIKAATESLKISREVNDKDGESHALNVIFNLENGEASAPANALPLAEPSPESEAPAKAKPNSTFVQLEFDPVASVILDGAKQVIAVDTVELDTPLMDAGMDSLTSVAFRNGLMTGFGGMNLPSTLTFDCPSVRQIVHHIVDRSEFEAITAPL